MAARLTVASVMALALIANDAAAYERHVIGPRLERRLLSVKALPTEMVDVFVRRAGSQPQRMRMTLAQAARMAPEVERLEMAPRLYPLMDRSARAVHVTDVHDGVGLRAGRSGKGVLVGVLDTGIDPNHPAFFDKEGKSRIVAIWDQDGDGDGPSGFDYGSVCDRGMINDRKCRMGDEQGHGTHVAGILAGAMAPHVGVAPEAELVVVKSSRFTDVAGAVEWMFRVARDQGKPIVVNLSIGGHLGPHDGQSELELALQKLQGPGRILVAAAGNDGATPIHLSGTASSDARAELLLPLPGAPTPTMLEIWEQGINGIALYVELRDEHGVLLDRKLLTQRTDETLRAYGALQGTASYLTEPGTDGQTGRTHHVVTIDRSDMDESAQEARWFLAWRSTTSFDAWISVDDYRYGSAEFVTELTGTDRTPSFVAGDVLKTLTIPGTARRMITVGSYVTRNEWESRFGKTFRLNRVQLDSLSEFSSHGPSAAPEITGDKPDLVAPGQLIAAPLSASAQGFANAVALDQHFAVMQGTSMASPHVAGTVALMLEGNAQLTPEEAKDILVRTATTSNQFDGQTPNERSGFGRLDALAAVQAVDGAHSKSGCHNLPNTEGLVLISAIAVAMASMMFQRRMRLYRVRWAQNNQ